MLTIWGRGFEKVQFWTTSVFPTRFWENSCFYLSLQTSPPALLEHSVCSGSTQRTRFEWSVSSPESSWHRQDTAALSSCTRLSLSPWSFSHSFVFPHSLLLSLYLALVILPPLKPHHVLPCLSIRVTSLLLFVLSVLSFLSHSLASHCSRRLALADTAVAVWRFIVCGSDKFKFVMIGACMGFWAL